MLVAYVIVHSTGSSYLGKSGWTSSLPFARRFNSYYSAIDFCSDCSLFDQGVTISRLADYGYGVEIEEVIN